MYLNKLRTETLETGEYMLTSPLIYDSEKHGLIVAQTGFITDFYSFFARVMMPRDKRPSVSHDKLYRDDGDYSFTRRQADAIFYEALRSLGINVVSSYALWLGVRSGGWRSFKKGEENA